MNGLVFHHGAVSEREGLARADLVDAAIRIRCVVGERYPAARDLWTKRPHAIGHGSNYLCSRDPQVAEFHHCAIGKSYDQIAVRAIRSHEAEPFVRR